MKFNSAYIHHGYLTWQIPYLFMRMLWFRTAKRQSNIEHDCSALFRSLIIKVSIQFVYEFHPRGHLQGHLQAWRWYLRLPEDISLWSIKLCNVLSLVENASRINHNFSRYWNTILYVWNEMSSERARRSLVFSSHPPAITYPKSRTSRDIRMLASQSNNNR